MKISFGCAAYAAIGGISFFMQKVRLFEQRLEAHPLHKSPRLPELLGAYERREAQRRRIDEVTHSLTQKVSLIQMDDLVGRKRVLRRLGFCNEHDVIELKGRVACEITSADELVLTELLFEGTFNRLSAEQVASLLSCFVFDERASEMPKLSAEMADALRTLQVSLPQCSVSIKHMRHPDFFT